MIPETSSELDALAIESGRQAEEVRELLGPLGAEELRWRPSESRWSVAGHVAHLCILNEAYLVVLDDRIRRARERGAPMSEGPYRHPLLARWFVGTMEPPPRRRVKTARSMVPDPDVDVAGVLERFERGQRALMTALDGARGIDLGRARFSSPFLRVLRLSLGTGFELLLAHNRRHIWLIRETLAEEGFPLRGGGSSG
jgi:hypothetical protein